MATENGVLALSKQTYLGDHIYVNGIEQEEIVFESRGTLLDEESINLSAKNKKLAK